MSLTVAAFRQLEDRDYRVLNAVERGMARHKYVPLRLIPVLSGLPEKEVANRLRRLNALGLVQRRIGAYIGYMLTTRGYDCLALNVLVKRGVLKALSLRPLGIGKESDVLEGLSSAGERVAVKFHRHGRVSFRSARKLRTYVGERRHISWLYEARLAAEYEFQALNILYSKGVSVPRPIHQNRHAVVTALVDGALLSDVYVLSDPEGVLNNIIKNVVKAYVEDVIHGDLSEFNVLVNREENVFLIDWPQWVSRAHPNAESILRRDVNNIIRFFRRRFRLNVDFETVWRTMFSNT